MRIRKDGRIYPVTIERVEDPALIDALKDTIEMEAAAFFGWEEIAPRPEQPPNDVWFFLISE